MGVYIPNMDMPKYGQMLVIFPDGTAYVCFNGMRERLAQAEAVPVPPHMAVAIEKILSERTRQMELWGECSDNHPFEWMSILGEEFGELCEAVNETYFKKTELTRNTAAMKR